ncbi:MAG: hypothetical protein A2506_04560 [Elusimicrobia bacterium RIFOXYD12_FULL_66_9]|nr:MAG: hypothetical protein A2506_04560 [Elusimicrobia bacterium RIFOXYD12_FULL_66_9]
MAEKNASNAARPPADAPTPTMGNEAEGVLVAFRGAFMLAFFMMKSCELLRSGTRIPRTR